MIRSYRCLLLLSLLSPALSAESSLLVGPKVTALGVPTPFRGGIEAKWKNIFGLSVDYGFSPRVRREDDTFLVKGWTAAAKYYIWEGAFYVGLGVGGQKFSAARSQVIAGNPAEVNVDVTSFLIIPQVGWRWVYDSGFYFGVELGVQIPVANESKVTTNASPAQQAHPNYSDAYKQVKDAADTGSRYPLPHFALLQVGYFF